MRRTAAAPRRASPTHPTPPPRRAAVYRPCTAPPAAQGAPARIAHVVDAGALAVLAATLETEERPHALEPLRLLARTHGAAARVREALPPRVWAEVSAQPAPPAPPGGVGVPLKLVTGNR